MKDFLERLEARLLSRQATHRELHWFWRAVWVAGGFALLGAGVAMLVLPGPGLLVLTLALGVLALEFSWAEWILRRGVRAGGKLRLPSARTLFVLALVAAGGAAVALVAYIYFFT